MNHAPAVPLGTRFRMSKLGAARCPRLSQKQGIVIGGSRNPSSVLVQFDGNATPTSLHRDYLEEIRAEEETKITEGTLQAVS